MGTGVWGRQGDGEVESEESNERQLFQEGCQEFPGGLVVKDPVMSLLWGVVHPWSQNFQVPEAQRKKKEEKKANEGAN